MGRVGFVGVALEPEVGDVEVEGSALVEHLAGRRPQGPGRLTEARGHAGVDIAVGVADIGVPGRQGRAGIEGEVPILQVVEALLFRDQVEAVVVLEPEGGVHGGVGKPGGIGEAVLIDLLVIGEKGIQRQPRCHAVAQTGHPEGRGLCLVVLGWGEGLPVGVVNLEVGEDLALGQRRRGRLLDGRARPLERGRTEAGDTVVRRGDQGCQRQGEAARKRLILHDCFLQNKDHNPKMPNRSESPTARPPRVPSPAEGALVPPSPVVATVKSPP